MSLNNLETSKRELIKNHKVNFDKHHLWGEIDAKLKKKRKQRSFVVLFITIFTLLLSFSYFNTYLFERNVLVNSSKFSSEKENYQGQANLYTEKQEICPVVKKPQKKVHRSEYKSKQILLPSVDDLKFNNYEIRENSNVYKIDRRNDIFFKTGNDQYDTNILSLPDIQVKATTNYKNNINPELALRDKLIKKQAINLYVGIGKATRKLNADMYDREAIKLKKFKNEKETILEQISVGMEYKHFINQKLSISFGLRGSSITEKFHHTYLLEEDFGSIDNFSSIKRTSYEFKNYNVYQFADFSTSIGYIIILTNKINLMLEGGISSTLVFNYNGDIMDEKFMPQHYDETRYFTDLFQSNLGASISYQISKDYDISLSSLFTVGLTGYNPQKSSIVQRYNVYSANLGVIRYFGN